MQSVMREETMKCLLVNFPFERCSSKVWHPKNIFFEFLYITFLMLNRHSVWCQNEWKSCDALWWKVRKGCDILHCWWERPTQLSFGQRRSNSHWVGVSRSNLPKVRLSSLAFFKHPSSCHENTAVCTLYKTHWKVACLLVKDTLDLYGPLDVDKWFFGATAFYALAHVGTNGGRVIQKIESRMVIWQNTKEWQLTIITAFLLQFLDHRAKNIYSNPSSPKSGNSLLCIFVEPLPLAIVYVCAQNKACLKARWISAGKSSKKKLAKTQQSESAPIALA